MWYKIIHIIILILAVHNIGHTFTIQSLFNPVRAYLNRKLGKFWSDIVTCPYCFSHHVALWMVFFYTPFEIHSNFWLNWFIWWMAIAGASNLITYILCDKIKRPKEIKKPTPFTPLPLSIGGKPIMQKPEDTGTIEFRLGEITSVSNVNQS